jgi:hypothetical protein
MSIKDDLGLVHFPVGAITTAAAAPLFLDITSSRVLMSFKAVATKEDARVAFECFCCKKLVITIHADVHIFLFHVSWKQHFH